MGRIRRIRLTVDELAALEIAVDPAVDESELSRDAGLRSLAARQLVRVAPDGSLTIDADLDALLGPCRQPQWELLLAVDEAERTRIGRVAGDEAGTVILEQPVLEGVVEVSELGANVDLAAFVVARIQPEAGGSATKGSTEEQTFVIQRAKQVRGLRAQRETVLRWVETAGGAFLLEDAGGEDAARRVTPGELVDAITELVATTCSGSDLHDLEPT